MLRSYRVPDNVTVIYQKKTGVVTGIFKDDRSMYVVFFNRFVLSLSFDEYKEFLSVIGSFSNDTKN